MRKGEIKRLEVTEDNCYSLLPEFLDCCLSCRIATPAHMLDICLAICASDENTGTNRKELDADRLLVESDEVWGKVLSYLVAYRASEGTPDLPKIQRARVLADALLVAMQEKGYAIKPPYASESTRKVASIINAPCRSVSNSNGGMLDVVTILKEIQNALVDDSGCDNYRDILQIFEYLTKFKTRLNCIRPIYLPESLCGRIGDESLYKNIYFSDKNVSRKCDIYKVINSSILQEFNLADDYGMAFLILDVRKVLSKKYILSVDFDTYCAVNKNIKLINALNEVFTLSNEVNESVLSTLILVLIYACPRRLMFKNILAVIKDGAYV